MVVGGGVVDAESDRDGVEETAREISAEVEGEFVKPRPHGFVREERSVGAAVGGGDGDREAFRAVVFDAVQFHGDAGGGFARGGVEDVGGNFSGHAFSR